VGARILGVNATVELIATDEAGVNESRLRLARVGLGNVAGFLAGGIHTWIAAGYPVQPCDEISVGEVSQWLCSGNGKYLLLDVREPAERNAGFIPGSISIPLPQLKQRATELSGPNAIAVYCKSGYRSSIATSLLQAAGLPQVINVVGGYDAWLRSLAAPS
jgi:hydroxyacylglutathione hydrolase